MRRDLRERLAGVSNRAAGVLLILAIAGATSLALAPGLFAERLPFEAAELGSVATSTVKANRDYDIPDEATTRRKREAAVAAVRAVYVHDAAALRAALERIRSGFELARRQAGDEMPADARPDIERALGARLEDAEFEVLAAAGFSREAEQAVARLASGAMRQLVVSDREELAQHRDRGISILRLDGGSPPVEEVLSEVDGIRDLARVREAIGGEVMELPGAPAALRRAVVNLARREIRANLKHDPDLTRTRREEAAAAVKPVIIQLKKGEKVVGDGERIEARHLVVLQGMRAQSQRSDMLQIRLGGGLYGLLVALSLFAFVSGIPLAPLRQKDRLFLALLLVLGLFGTDCWIAAAEVLRERTPEIPAQAWTWVVPFASGAMLVRFVLGTQVALIFAVAFSALAGVLAGNSLDVALFALVGAAGGTAFVGRARDRAGIFRAGLVAGLGQAAAVVCFALFAGKIASWDVLINVVAALVGGALLAPAVVMSLLPAAEGLFGYTSDIRLLELANLNHPALKELIVRAPGTYHHSIIVGTLVEGAAEAIGANPLLAKVCAYYHDLGKGKQPLYFGENQRGVNAHDELPPEESARLIIEHVSRGLEIARKYKLPKQVADAIPEHHGTRLVGYFFHKAVKAAEGRPDTPPVDPEAFRYRGPRPQSRETALIMMADAVEAASRAMPAPTPEKLEALVQKLINGIFADGQLDECDLTLRDLSRIARSFCTTLGGIYHSRPDYPAAARGPQSQLTAAGAAAVVGNGAGKVAR